MITKIDFQKYENVRLSGVCNMFNIDYVQSVTGLTRIKILLIMQNYAGYRDRFESKELQKMKGKILK